MKMNVTFSEQMQTAINGNHMYKMVDVGTVGIRNVENVNLIF